MNELTTNEYLNNLVEQIKAIAAVKTFNSRLEIIEGKWLIGKEIEETLNQVKIPDINKRLSSVLHWSEREIYRCRRFYSKYPFDNFDKVIDSLPSGKLTWHDITNQYLLEKPKKKEREYISIRIDEENQILFIKSKYKQFKIEFYE